MKFLNLLPVIFLLAACGGGGGSDNTPAPPANVAPTANFTAACTNKECVFTDGSTDNDGAIASYAWNFGDGNTSTEASPTHSFADYSDYTVQLTVTDNDSATDSTSQTVTVSPPPNEAPVAEFAFECTGLVCSFTSTSTDNDGSILGFAWDFGDEQNSDKENPSHTFSGFGEYTIKLTVTDNLGETGIKTQSVITSTDVNSSDFVDWDSYKNEIDKFSQYYIDLPTKINIHQVWFDSLQIPTDQFTTNTNFLSSVEMPEHGVGYGAFINIDDNQQLVFYANWVPNKPYSGSALALEYKNGVPFELHVKRIDGATHPWVLNNADGSQQVIFPGVDEGKIPTEDGRADGPSYTFNPITKQWTDINIQLGAHNSIVFDYDKDGDDDVLAQNWHNGIFNGNAVLIENRDSSLIPVEVNSRDYVPGHMGLAPFYYEDDKLAIVFTDAAGIPSQYNIEPERNVIAYYESDLKTVTRIHQLPIPYFERPIFEGINQILPGWEGGVGLSHDVTAKAIDIDYDDDIDIIISSMIWSKEHPYGVLQILVNHDGEYIDETDSRLFNWILPGSSAHRLDFLDINGDSFVDILVSDHGYASVNGGNDDLDEAIRSGSRVLINDGAGHFVTIAHQQINDPPSFLPSYIPSMDKQGKLRWTVMDTKGTDNIRIITRQVLKNYSTGPNGIDPSFWGEPKYNEFYYLLHNLDAREAVERGEYSTGLEHYLQVGKKLNLPTHAQFHSK